MGVKGPISKRMRNQFMKKGGVFFKQAIYPEGSFEAGYAPDGSMIAPTGDGKFWRYLARYGMYELYGDGPGSTAYYGKCVKPDHEAFGWWMGYSHRAALFFKPGYKLFEEDYKGESGTEDMSNVPFTERGAITIETDEQCMLAAKNFGAYVS